MLQGDAIVEPRDNLLLRRGARGVISPVRQPPTVADDRVS